MADKIEVAQAYVSIIPSMAGSQSEITAQLTGVTTTASETAGEEGGKKFGDTFANALKTTGAVIGAAMTAVTGAAVATGKAFLDAANDVSAMGDAIGDNAAKMMLDTQSYQEWDFVLQRAGSSIDAMKTSMKTLANAAVDGSDAFEALGISQEQLAEMNQAELFEATVKALQNVTDEQQRMVLASDLLGKGAVELGGIFAMTNEELDASKQKMYELGAYMDEDAIAASDNYQDTMIDVQDSLKGLKISMMKDFLPGITSVMTGLSKVFSGNGGIEEIKSGLESVISKITELSPQFFEIAEAIITSLLAGFGPMLPQLVTSLFNFVNQALLTLTGMIPQLLPAITAGIKGIMTAVFDCLPVIIQSLLELVTALVTWLSEGDNVTNFVNGIVQLVSLIAAQLSEVLPVLLPAIVKIIGDVANALMSPENVMTLVGAALQILGAIVAALIASVPELIEFVIGVFENLGGLFAKFLEFVVPFVTHGLETLIGLVTSWGSGVWEFISGLINTIRDGFTNWLNNLKTNFTNAFNFIRDKVSNIVEKVKTLVSSVIEKIKELPEKVVSIGRDLITGLWNGIGDKISWIKDKIASMGESITNAIKGVFGIASPSKVFAGIGGFLAEGLGEGFDDGMKDVKSDMLGNMEGLTGSMTAQVSAYGAQGAARLGETTNYNGGSVTINVYGAEGQSTNELAETIAKKLEDMTRRKGVIYA